MLDEIDQGENSLSDFKEELLSQLNKKTSYGYGIDLEEMVNAGLHFGHRLTNYNPQMKPYIQTIRNSVRIINLEKTAEKLEEALKFIELLIKEKKTVLVIGTKVQAKNLVGEFAEKTGLPFVNNRWLGGTLTNFEVIKKRIAFLSQLEEGKESSDFGKYTKKEQIKFNNKIQKLTTNFGGIRNLEKVPEAILVLDMRKEATAVREARRTGIKLIAVCDTNVNPLLADYPIPANDDSVSSIKYILDKVAETVINSRLPAEPAVAPEPAAANS